MYSQVIKYPCVYVVVDPRYEFESQIIQPAPGVLMTFVHINVLKWSKETLLAIKEKWRTVRPRLPAIVYAVGIETDRKWEKFVTLYGFKHLSDCTCVDGKERRIFVNMVNSDR